MSTFQVAHLHEQGQDIIMVLVKRQLTDEEQYALQRAANHAGLRGTVVPVWHRGGDSFGFQAPPQWHSFFRSIGWTDICYNVNRTLTTS